MAKSKKPQQTTRDKSFNYSEDTGTNTISTIVSYTANKNNKNIRLLDMDSSISVTGQKIKDHAAANITMEEEGISIDTKIEDGTKTYRIYGAPFQSVLNNKQNYNNCGVESTLNNLATAGIIKMNENLKDQKSVEKNFLKRVWDLGLVADAGVLGTLDQPDGGTLPDDYRDIFRLFDIESEAYFITRKCDGTQLSNINELAYKISQGYGAVLGLCSGRLWQEQKSESGETRIDHAVAIIGVVYEDGTSPAITDEEGNITGFNAPAGFYIHDTGAWMTRYISLEEFLYVSLYDEHGMSFDSFNKYVDYDNTMTEEEFDALYDPDKYLSNVREFDSELRQYIGKKPNGIFVTLTSEPIKTEMFNLNATGDKQNNIIWGNSGDNVIKGMAGNDTLYGNAGDDEIRGGAGNDIIIGNKLSSVTKEWLNTGLDFKIGNEIDTYDPAKEVAPLGINQIYGDAGNDIIIGGDDIDLIYGGAGNDYIYGGRGRNAIYGGSGNDVLVGSWDNDRLFGDAGNDLIIGLGDDDTVHAGAGNDTIFGGGGNDVMETGAGNDTIYFEGMKHGLDAVMSQSGKTTLNFIDETVGEIVVSEGAEIGDIIFKLDKQDEGKNYDLKMLYTDAEEDATDGVVFQDFYNGKKAKALEIVDANDDLYKVTVSNSSAIKVTTGNNIVFSNRKEGATISTSIGNDVVTMVQSTMADYKYADSDKYIDKIKYTGGLDKYVSEERNTYYTVEKFDSTTTLAILDNIEPVKKINTDALELLEENGEELIVSTNDRLYLDCTKDKLNFFFDVGINQNDVATTTSEDGLYIVDGLDVDKMLSVATKADDLTGFIYMGGFFGEDVDEETGDVTYKEFTEGSFYGNGRIEHIYYNGDTPYEDLATYLEGIASSVANWLNGAYNTGDYSTAFDAFNDFDSLSGEAQNALVACYNVNV